MPELLSQQRGDLVLFLVMADGLREPLFRHFKEMGKDVCGV